MAAPLSPDPVRDYRPEYIPAYIANGLVGLRCGRIPFRDGTSMANGFAGLDVNDGLEGFARTPFPLGADISVNQLRLSHVGHLVQFIEQRYDFATAELTTVLDFHAGDTTARIEVLQLCSHTQPSVVAQEIRVRVDRAADVAISAGIDPTGVPGTADYQARPSGKPTEPAPDGILIWSSHGNVAQCGLAYHTELLGADDAERTTHRRDEPGMTSTSYRFRARRDRTYRIRQMTSLVPSLVHPHPADHAARMLALAVEKGWDRLRADHEAAWAELWRSRIELIGAPRRWQAITDASLFYLLTSVHPASIASTSLFGLAYWPNYHYYYGHVMWDIETFALPPLVLAEPKSARAILDYRFRHLEAAKINARLGGWSGAMYPWESCPMHGEEVTPGSSAPHKGHATVDVALAFASYVHGTGDRDYLDRYAWPVIQAVAEWIESRVERTRRGYEIREMTGPAETDPPVDNNAFVNMAAAQVLREATGFAEQLGLPPHRRWTEIADRLVVPRAERGHLANHDDYRVTEEKGGTPEAAAGIFPAGYRVDAKTEAATFRFAAVEQAPSYVGTPMLSAFLPFYAARAGLADLSTELLETGYANFINEPWLETDEFPKPDVAKPRVGPMFANIGGFLTTLYYGYPGLRLGPGDPGTWCERPVVMPGGWRGLHVERVFVRGDEMSLTAEAGKPAAILDGKRLRRVS
jgi:trehalose/maltose hydrolase-like predicted phosphorylase